MAMTDDDLVRQLDSVPLVELPPLARNAAVLARGADLPRTANGHVCISFATCYSRWRLARHRKL